MQFRIFLLSLLFAMPAFAQRGNQGNYKLAEKFSSDFINQYVHSTQVRPQWIGESDRFWYQFKTSEGQHYWLVDPGARSKEPLFDHDELAARLSLALRTPIDAPHLNFSKAEIDDEGKQFSFEFKERKFAFDRMSGELSDRGKAEKPQPRPRPGSDEKPKKKPWEHRSFSPDKTAYLFGKGFDLYYVEASPEVKKQVEAKTAEIEAKEKAEKEGKGKDQQETEKDEDKEEDKDEVESDQKDEEFKDDRDEREKWADDIDEERAFRLTRDGERHYSWVPLFGRRNLEEDDKIDLEEKVAVRVNWSEDSQAFFVNRNDSRDVNELFLVNALAKPRPKLERYKYAMPGEEKVQRSDLYYFQRNTRKLGKVELKWKDESYLNVHWKPETTELRFVRRDRLRRNVELVAVELASGEESVLINDGYEIGLIETQPVRYLKDREEMIWWSERSGWGHYYLYDLEGELKNTITWGTFKASRIVEVDEEKGVLYFYGNGREKGENIYYSHLYRVDLDGNRLSLLDPGDAMHRSVLSPKQTYLVDNYNRVDLAPRSVLRSADGQAIMDLETTDLSQLAATGWKLPETFVVKAADGVTDLFGNLWKPFDFDANKKYPVILHVYPGPQTEGVTHTFSATGGGRQQLAQLGFIVIQVGHRGGTPGRSKAYQNHSYWNMRDYALEDKKVAVEKLAATRPFIDVDRVGIYGHSGGGFFTATALLKPPYNKFFKVGVSSAGNHDNNVYNNSWSERYHGLKEVEVKKKKQKKGAEKTEEKVDLRNIGAASSTAQKGKLGTRRGSAREAQSVKQGSALTKQDEQEGASQEGEEGDGKETKFEIRIPTNAELAANLRGHLLLVHGDMDNNVHPAGTVRLVDALIKANKRFDLLYIPGARHGFGAARGYFTQRMWEYFTEHLLGDYQSSADITEKVGR